MDSDIILRQQNRSTATDKPATDGKTGFKAMVFVDAIVENIVKEVFSNIDLGKVQNALKGGSLKCLYDTWRGGHIEITAIDLENLTTPDLAAPATKAHMEETMLDYTAVAIDSLGGDKVETLLQAAQSAALGEKEYLSVHEIEDYLCFAVVRPTDGASPA